MSEWSFAPAHAAEGQRLRAGDRKRSRRRAERQEDVARKSVNPRLARPCSDRAERPEAERSYDRHKHSAAWRDGQGCDSYVLLRVATLCGRRQFDFLPFLRHWGMMLGRTSGRA